MENLAISADGRYIAAGSGADKTLYLFDKDKEKPRSFGKSGRRSDGKRLCHLWLEGKKGILLNFSLSWPCQ